MRLLQYLTSAVAATVLCLVDSTHASTRARKPLNYLSVLESPRIHTPSKRVNAYSSFDLTFDLHQHAQHVRLALEPNYDILSDDAHVVFVDQDGNHRHAEKIDRHSHKVFQGKAFVVDDDGASDHVGWARITVRRDGVQPLFTGAFSIMGDHHNILLSSTYMATKHPLDPDVEETDDEYMVVWRNTDVSRQQHPAELNRRSLDARTCGSDALAFNSDPDHPVYRGLLKREDGYWGAMPMSGLLGKRQNIDGGGAGTGGSSVNLNNSIGSTSGCPTTRKVALIGIATDCGYTASFNSTESLRANVIDTVNTASDLYQATFNITLGLRNLTISDAECPSTASAQTPWNLGCSSSMTMTDRLTNFSSWRGQHGDENAYWSLWTTCNTGAEVGLAWLGQLCNTGTAAQSSSSQSDDAIAGTNVVARTSTEWQVFAHETGHTFGAVHDCDSSTCADATVVSSNQCCPLSQSTCDASAQYIMNPYSEPGIQSFSPCTIGNICSGLGSSSVQSSCLTDNKGIATITGQQCGNGIVEDGEDCDCGGEESCQTDPCCDATTCKFTSGSVCDPSNEGCCTAQCQFSAEGTVCRASTGSCDPQEVCSGTNATCPADANSPDGTSCGTDLKCASGQCTSRDLQCKTAMGSYTQNNDTYACDSQVCTLSCASPAFGYNVCYTMQQNFLDGTPCGGSGKCSNGVCRGGSVTGRVGSWINDNKTLVIALASALGGLLVIALLGCCIRACRRPRAKAVAPGYHRSRRAHARHGWDGPPIPEQMQQRGYGGDTGSSWQAPPPPLPQGATPTEWGGYPMQPPPSYARATRYA
ncbi:hypothetical protein DV735_g1043, partial [Chaetothyriales sp. CBS 134920]